MQMLQANAKPDRSEPFEDYSIFLYRQTAPKFEDRVKDLEKQFTYVPDHDNRITGLKPLTNTNADEDIASKIKSLEDKWSNQQPADKKPKDLLRAIGKIETSDWNIKQIEKKILENKVGKPSSLNADKERVPRWSREEFRTRQTKMEKKHLDRQDSSEAKYADIDKNIKQLELKLKEGTTRELGQNKVASITEKLVSKIPADKKPLEKPAQPKPVNLPVQSGSEFCHFCGKRVYLMERLSAESRFFHHGCFKCQYCHTQLRLGSYMFDRDGQYGYRFFCMHHYGMQGELPRPTKVVRKPSQKGTREAGRSPQKKPLSGVAGVDLLDRVQTPERIEFSNLSAGNISSDHEEPLSQMDEDEWTDKNFGASCNELDESEGDSSSSLSDTDSDDEDAFDDALEQPITKEGTMKWAERWKNSYRKGRHSNSDGYSSSDHSSYYENNSDDSDSDTATEGEEEIRARELRKQEVRVEPPVVQTDTGTDTEVKTSLDILPSETVPDILSYHSHLDSSKNLRLNKSPSNYSINSEVFNSAESDLDFNMNKTVTSDPNVVVGKLTVTPRSDSKPPIDTKHVPKLNNLSKSATAGILNTTKPRRNFVLPPRDQRKSFGQEFMPKYKLDEPLLVIKRTPSKVNLPKEIKPKVAVNTKVLDTKKYFGASKPPAKSKIKRSDANAVPPKAPLVKQTSLPETTNEIKDANAKFNFDLKDDDLENIDNYIEDLLTKKDELEKPIDPNKFAFKIEPEVVVKTDDENISSSIEDLFNALEKETNMPEPDLQKQSDEKMEDLLKWMEEMNYQTPERKVYKSVSDVKYKNLETVLKTAQRSDSVVSKLPKNNLAFFETILKGKVPKDSSSSSEENLFESSPKGLCRSKTEVHFNRTKKPRTSVDLDAVSKVDIKSVLKKFESMDQEDEYVKPKPEKPVVKRFSSGNFKSTSGDVKGRRLPNIVKPKPISKTIEKFESEPKEFKVLKYKVHEPKRVLNTKYDDKSFEESMKDLEKFVEETIESIGSKSKPSRPKSGELGKSKSDWCVNITVSSKVSPEFLKMQQELNLSKENKSMDSNKENIGYNTQEIKNDLENSNSNIQNVLPKLTMEETQLDFSKELKDFQVAMSALTGDTSTSENEFEHQKFTESTDSSVSDDDDNNNDTNSDESSVSSEYNMEANIPLNVSEAVESSSLEGIISEHSPSDVPSKSQNNVSQILVKNEDNCDLTGKESKPNISNVITEQIANIDELYAKVNKPKKDVSYSPPVPQRRKHSQGEPSSLVPRPPPRGIRQKSLEQRISSDNCLPVAPQRKRCNTVSPLPRRKHQLDEPVALNTKGRSTSTGNIEVRKEVVKSFNIPEPQKVIINGPRSRSSENLSKFPPKLERKDKDKDCCIQ